MYYITDCEYNREHGPDKIGFVVDEKPVGLFYVEWNRKAVAV